MRHEDLARIEAGGVVAVLRGVDADVVVDVAEAVAAGGVTALEVTMDSGDALDALESVADAFAGRDVLVGAGTVLDAETARAALLAGAEFVVAPNFDPGTVEVCNRYGAVVAPGVATPTEAVDAYEAGADLVKLFPAGDLGPGYLSSLRGPLGQIPVMPTGGVGPDNAGDFVDAGAIAVGAGGAIVDHEAIDRGDYDAITESAESLVDAVAEARE